MPLLIRPTIRREFADEFLDEKTAEALVRVIVDQRDRLTATAEWFVLLKQARRSAKIRGGNPQDSYFPRCFELAVEHGRPGSGAAAIAMETVVEIAEDARGRTVEDLRSYLTLPVRDNLGQRVSLKWGNRDLGGVSTSPDLGRVQGLLDVLGDVSSGQAEALFRQLVEGLAGTAYGRSVWVGVGVDWGGEIPVAAGLTAYLIPPEPELGHVASTSTMPSPLDRTVYERLFEVLRASAKHGELPGISELVDREVDRVCAPLGLNSESLRVAVLLGVALAVGIDPLGQSSAEGATRAHRDMNRRWRREAAVMKARRMVVVDDIDGGELAELARSLGATWRLYVRRMWVRLHGRDVRKASLIDAAELWQILAGVGLSVIMDHRMRVRAALRAAAGGSVS